MEMKVVGELLEHDDGSATVCLDLDEEAKLYLIQRGFEVVLARSMDKMDEESNREETK